MKNVFIIAAILGVLVITSCTSASAPPLDVGDRLIVPAGHIFVIPPQGIRFANGATIRVQPQ